MANYKIIIQYDGTRYKGWQIQSSTEDTIQGKLQTIISKMCGHEVDIIGSGRTDAGVHALGQVANFHLKEEINVDQFLDELNSNLPEDIAVIDITRVDDRFHSRFSALSKTYRYRIHTGNISNVFERKYIYNYKGEELDVIAMKQAATYLIGEHDFKAFCGNKHMKKSTVRNIHNIDIKYSSDEIVLEYTGDGFLQNMIRIITGTLIEVGDKRRRPEEIKIILESQNRELAGYTAPASGLCLVKVDY